MRLRSSTIDALHCGLAGDEHWSERTEDALLFYRLRNDISHLLAAGKDDAAVARLERFDALRARFLLSPRKAYEVVSRDLEAVHKRVDDAYKQRIIPWLSFWRSRGAVVSQHFKDTSVILAALTQAAAEHGDDSPVSAAAEAWIDRHTPNALWIRRSHRPTRWLGDAGALRTLLLKPHSRFGLAEVSRERVALASADGLSVIELRSGEQTPYGTGSCRAVFSGPEPDTFLSLSASALALWSHGESTPTWQRDLPTLGALQGALMTETHMVLWDETGHAAWADLDTGIAFGVESPDGLPFRGATACGDEMVGLWTDRQLCVFALVDGDLHETLFPDKDIFLGAVGLDSECLLAWSVDVDPDLIVSSLAEDVRGCLATDIGDMIQDTSIVEWNFHEGWLERTFNDEDRHFAQAPALVQSRPSALVKDDHWFPFTMTRSMDGRLFGVTLDGTVIDVRRTAEGLTAWPRFGLDAIPDALFVTRTHRLVSWSEYLGHVNAHGKELGGHISELEGVVSLGDGFASWDVSGVVQIWGPAPKSSPKEGSIEGGLTHRRAQFLKRLNEPMDDLDLTTCGGYEFRACADGFELVRSSGEVRMATWFTVPGYEPLLLNESGTMGVQSNTSVSSHELQLFRGNERMSMTALMATDDHERPSTPHQNKRAEVESRFRGVLEKGKLTRMFSLMGPREEAVIARYLGLNPGQLAKPKGAGPDDDKARKRIQSIEAKALSKLRLKKRPKLPETE